MLQAGITTGSYIKSQGRPQNLFDLRGDTTGHLIAHRAVKIIVIKMNE